jgi:hypothetical protein
VEDYCRVCRLVAAEMPPPPVEEAGAGARAGAGCCGASRDRKSALKVGMLGGKGGRGVGEGRDGDYIISAAFLRFWLCHSSLKGAATMRRRRQRGRGGGLYLAVVDMKGAETLRR